jgi:hypothetical protein
MTEEPKAADVNPGEPNRSDPNPIEPKAPESGRLPPAADRSKRPLLERIGLAFVALVLGSMFGAIAAAAWCGGEVFLAAMGAIGCAMTLWVGGLTLFRG